MSYDRLKFKCRHDGCTQAFLTADARNGHESVHQSVCHACQRPGASHRGVDGELYHRDCAREYDREVRLRSDGGLAITPEELARRKRARSSTPTEDRPSCPQCGRNHLKYLNNKWGTANGRWYCDECHEHVEPEGHP